MNLQHMVNDLSDLRSEWERNCYSPDISEKGDWTHGVAYGLRLAFHLIQRHMVAPRAMRGQSQTPYLDSRDLPARRTVS